MIGDVLALGINGVLGLIEAGRAIFGHDYEPDHWSAVIVVAVFGVLGVWLLWRVTLR